LIGGYPDSSARQTRDPAMENSLFGSGAVPGSIPAELTEHPMVRYNNVTAPTEGRYREIPERFGDSSHRNEIQFRTEPKRYKMTKNHVNKHKTRFILVLNINLCDNKNQY